ncbi:hypothetical protein [Streptomyces sp. NBC_01174]|uniref:hypothetical protein n=1 Tax=Streptomyces sp. NBC_01174 TaxID=2903758 RepID=UPI0038637D34|nr:hypothetical protein OG414_31500 [Streptomyces sp. NBC_01174]
MIVGRGTAAVLAAAGLLVTAVPAAQADTATAAATSEVTPGSETDTPSLVTGLGGRRGQPGAVARRHDRLDEPREAGPPRGPVLIRPDA